MSRQSFESIAPGYGAIFDALVRDEILMWNGTTYAYADGHSDASLGAVFVNGRLLSSVEIDNVKQVFVPATFEKIKDDRIKVIDLTRPRTLMAIQHQSHTRWPNIKMHLGIFSRCIRMMLQIRRFRM